jgi:tetratricopeptide (TPR) repeat protein
MATALGLDEIRSHALTNIGTARSHLADVDGIRDLEQSIEIAEQIGSPQILRAYNNLFASYATLGDLDRAAATVRAGLLVADRFGNAGTPARFLRYELLHIAYWEGRWDEALELIEASLSEIGPGHHLSRWSFEMRGRIRLARDDVAGALEDAQKSLELGRQAKDPETFFPALSFAAVAALAAGRRQDAERLAGELLALKPVDHPIPHHVSPLFDLAWVLTALERSEELAESARQAPIRTRQTQAAGALASGDYARAAEMYAEIGARPNEAYARLRAAGQLVDAGRRTEADAQLQSALAFWRSVGATRYIREGEALMAASA